MHLHDQRRDPGGQVFRLFKLVLVIVVAPPERGDAALAFKGAELERRERQRADLGDELLLALGGDEARLVAQAPGGSSVVREEGELFGHGVNARKTVPKLTAASGK